MTSHLLAITIIILLLFCCSFNCSRRSIKSIFSTYDETSFTSQISENYSMIGRIALVSEMMSSQNLIKNIRNSSCAWRYIVKLCVTWQSLRFRSNFREHCQHIDIISLSSCSLILLSSFLSLMRSSLWLAFIRVRITLMRDAQLTLNWSKEL